MLSLRHRFRRRWSLFTRNRAGLLQLRPAEFCQRNLDRFAGSSFSRARRGTACPSWQAIRFMDCPTGLHGLDARGQLHISIGNSLAGAALEVVNVCRTHAVPVFLWKPFTSFLWLMPSLSPLMTAPVVVLQVVDFYHFHARWQKKDTNRCLGGRAWCF